MYFLFLNSDSIIYLGLPYAFIKRFATEVWKIFRNMLTTRGN